MEKESHSHPSFGQISFSRIQGHEKFYGSELPQDHYIEMNVHHSKIERNLNQDWFYNVGLPAITIRMTSGQFSEMITSLNRGTGTPCTIEMVDGRRIEKLPEFESRKEVHHKEFEKEMEQFAQRISKTQRSAKELVKKKTLSKDDIRQLEIQLDYMVMEIVSNIPFFAKQFQEMMDKVVFEAKTEVENAIQHKINVLGLNALHEQNKLLSND